MNHPKLLTQLSTCYVWSARRKQLLAKTGNFMDVILNFGAHPQRKATANSALRLPFQPLKWRVTEHALPTVALLEMGPGHPQHPHKHSQRQECSFACKQSHLFPWRVIERVNPSPCNDFSSLNLFCCCCLVWFFLC